MMRPVKGTYPEYFQHYIGLVREQDVLTALENSAATAMSLLNSIPEEKSEYSYEKGKWTIKQVFCHLCDAERVFAYRALRFARKDPQITPSYDDDMYAANAELQNRALYDIGEELSAVKKSTILLFRSFSDNTLLNQGDTTIGVATVLSTGFMISGHTLHHSNVLRQKYGV